MRRLTHSASSVLWKAPLVVLFIFISKPLESYAQGKGAAQVRKRREVSFDSGILLGGGLWSTPALPKLISTETDTADGSGLSIDIENYRPEVAAPFVLLNMRMFYPLNSVGWPFGLHFQMSHALTETPLLFFTLSPEKSSIRPKYALEGEAGARYDWLFRTWRMDIGLDIRAKRTFYLGANFTEFGPAGRLRVVVDKAIPRIKALGLTPLFSLELGGAPYLFVTGFDNRILTNGSGTIRDFAEVASISKSASALQYAATAEVGVWWTDRGQSRTQSLLLGYTFNSTQYAGLIERRSQESGNQLLNVSATMHIIALSLKSSFM